MEFNDNTNSRKNKKKFLLPAFFIFLAVGMLMFNSSIFIAGSDSNSNSNYNLKDGLSLNYYPSDTMQKEVEYQTSQINNETGENETITKTKKENIDIIKVTDSDFVKDNDKVEINLDIELTEIGQILSGAPGQMDYSECADELNEKGYTYNGGSFDSEIAEDLREELEDLSFSVLKGEEVESKRNIPKGIAVNPHDSFSVKVVMKPDFSENYKYASFKLGSHSTNVDLTNDLISYYELEETSGDILDSHGDNDGTNNGATRGVTGKIGNAFDFDFSNKDYVDMNIDIGIKQRNTYNVWIKKSTNLQDDIESIISLDRGDRFEGIAIQDGNPDLYYKLYTDTDDYVIDSGITVDNISNGEWHMVTATASIEDEEAKIYFDGDLKTTESISGNEIPESGNTYIGATGQDTPDKRTFDGTIDEVGIWDKALNSTEVSSLYNNGDGLAYDDFEGEEGLNVETLDPENIYYNSANLKANLTDLGEETNVSGYFLYRKEFTGDVGHGTYEHTDKQYLTETGIFNHTLDKLSDNSTYDYYVRIERENGSLVDESVKEFTTETRPYFELYTPKDNRIYIKDYDWDTGSNWDLTEDITFSADYVNPDNYNLINASIYTNITTQGEDEGGKIKTYDSFPISDYDLGSYDPIGYWTWFIDGYFEDYNGNIKKSKSRLRDFTIEYAPFINVTNATNIKDKSAKLKGYIFEYDSGFDRANISFQYREKGTSTWEETSFNLIKTDEKETEEEFSRNIYNLEPNTEYEYRLHYKYTDENENEIFNSETDIIEFKTYKELNVDTLEAEDITAFESKLNGNLTTMSYYDDVDVYFQYRRIG